MNENFQAWFSESKVVDKTGAPLVVYHSTFNDFSVFDATRDIGFHFGSASIANKRVDEAVKGRGRGDEKWTGLCIKPVYLAIANPFHFPSDPIAWQPPYLLRLIGDAIPSEERERILAMDVVAVASAHEEAERLRQAGIDVRRKNVYGRILVDLVQSRWVKVLAEARKDVYAEITAALVRAGFDGASYVNEVEGSGYGRAGRKKNADENMTWIAFTSHQVKSALGNSGRYDRTCADITDFAPAAAAALTARDYLAKLGRHIAPHA